MMRSRKRDTPVLVRAHDDTSSSTEANGRTLLQRSAERQSSGEPAVADDAGHERCR